MAVGSALLVFSDLIGRTIIAPQALQVGVITAFIGGPVFLYLLIRRKIHGYTGDCCGAVCLLVELSIYLVVRIA